MNWPSDASSAISSLSSTLGGESSHNRHHHEKTRPLPTTLHLGNGGGGGSHKRQRKRAPKVENYKQEVLPPWEEATDSIDGSLTGKSIECYTPPHHRSYDSTCASTTTEGGRSSVGSVYSDATRSEYPCCYGRRKDAKAAVYVILSALVALSLHHASTLVLIQVERAQTNAYFDAALQEAALAAGITTDADSAATNNAFKSLLSRGGESSSTMGAAPFLERREQALQSLESKGGDNEKKSKRDICAVLPPKSIDTPDLWMRYLSVILQASQFPDDLKFDHEDWTKSLLVKMQPSILQESEQSSAPSQVVSVAMDRVLGLLQKRVLDVDGEHSEPVRILVVGGEVATGEGCTAASVDVPLGSSMNHPGYCAWPNRFQQFVNKLFGLTGVVEVTNLAVEGSDLAYVRPLVRNGIYPSSLGENGTFDVILVAYGLRDYVSRVSSPDVDVLLDTIRDEMQLFMETVEIARQRHPCGEQPFPLVVYMDDYDGDSEMPLVPIINDNRLLHFRYGNGAMTVSQADKRARKKVPKHLPFGMAGHVVTSWILTYNLADSVRRHCDDGGSADTRQAIVAGKDSGQCKGTSGEGDKNDKTGGFESSKKNKCAMAWLAGPTGTVNSPIEMQQVLMPSVIENTGWSAKTDMTDGFARRLGLVAVNHGARLTLEFREIASEVRYVNVVALRRPEDNMDEEKPGRVRFTLLVKRAPYSDEGDKESMQETTFEMDNSVVADDDANRPTIYQFEADLGDDRAPVGSDVRLLVELIDGATFKIMGMMLCP